MIGWIMLHRKILEWQWYNKSEMVHLFIHLLLNANRKELFWNGMIVKRGQLATGLLSLNKETKISIQTLRTCLKRLESTNEIIVKSTNKFSIITICNYDEYQPEENESNKQLTNNQQATNNKQEVREYKKKYIYSDFYDYELKVANEYANKYPEAEKDSRAYQKYISWLFGKDEFLEVDILGKEIDNKKSNLLALKSQLKYIDFVKLKQGCNGKTMELFDSMENWKDLSKKRTNIYKTALTFLKNNKK